MEFSSGPEDDEDLKVITDELKVKIFSMIFSNLRFIFRLSSVRAFPNRNLWNAPNVFEKIQNWYEC